MTTGEACGNCRFWKDIYRYPIDRVFKGFVYADAYELNDGGHAGGLCRRYPPFHATPDAGEAYGFRLFPAVGASDWCGEWRPKVPDPDAAGGHPPWEEFVRPLSVLARRGLEKRQIDSWEKLLALRGGDEPLMWRGFGDSTYTKLIEAMKRAGVSPPGAWQLP